MGHACRTRHASVLRKGTAQLKPDTTLFYNLIAHHGLADKPIREFVASNWCQLMFSSGVGLASIYPSTSHKVRTQQRCLVATRHIRMAS